MTLSSASLHQTITFPDYSNAELHTILKGIMADKPLYCLTDDKHGAIATARLGRQRGTVGFGNARAVRNFFEQATARQASRIVSERAVGLAPDPWLLTRDDMLGPRELDVSGSTALRKLAGMRGLGMIKQQVSVRECLCVWGDTPLYYLRGTSGVSTAVALIK